MAQKPDYERTPRSKAVAADNRLVIAGLVMGLVVGGVFGFLMGNVLLGVGMGVIIGVVTAVSLRQAPKRDK